MPKKKTSVKQTKHQVDSSQEFLVLGHLIKYNLYLLSKSVVFSALSRSLSTNDAVLETNRVMSELDLDFKRRKATSEVEETVQ